MDYRYYGYFQTFNSLIIETQIIVTLIGFLAVFFIFWFNHQYNIGTKNKTEELKKNDAIVLKIATIAFIFILLIGVSIVINNTSFLYLRPYTLESIVRLTNTTNPIIPSDIQDTLTSQHLSFSYWTLFSFIYIAILLFSIDVIGIFTTRIKKLDNKQKNKIKGKNDEKNIRKKGGK